MDGLATRIAAGDIYLSDAADELDAVITAPELYTPLINVAVFGVSAGLAAVSFFGAGVWDLLISFLMGCIVGVGVYLAEIAPSFSQVCACVCVCVKRPDCQFSFRPKSAII